MRDERDFSRSSQIARLDDVWVLSVLRSFSIKKSCLCDMPAQGGELVLSARVSNYRSISIRSASMREDSSSPSTMM
jgi:hypothetical protein